MGAWSSLTEKFSCARQQGCLASEWMPPMFSELSCSSLQGSLRAKAGCLRFWLRFVGSPLRWGFCSLAWRHLGAVLLSFDEHLLVAAMCRGNGKACECC